MCLRLVTSAGPLTMTSVSLMNHIDVVVQQHEVFAFQGWCVGVSHVSQADPWYTSHTAEYTQFTRIFITFMSILSRSVPAGSHRICLKNIEKHTGYIIVSWPNHDLTYSLQWRHNERDGVIVYSAVYSGTDQSSMSLTFVRGIHPCPVNARHKDTVTRKMFPFDDVIMSRRVAMYWIRKSDGYLRVESEFMSRVH